MASFEQLGHEWDHTWAAGDDYANSLTATIDGVPIVWTAHMVEASITARYSTTVAATWGQAIDDDRLVLSAPADLAPGNYRTYVTLDGATTILAGTVRVARRNTPGLSQSTSTTVTVLHPDVTIDVTIDSGGAGAGQVDGGTPASPFGGTNPIDGGNP